MVIKREWQEPCIRCGETITLREYEGLEGGEYTEHYCDKGEGEGNE